MQADSEKCSIVQNLKTAPKTIVCPCRRSIHHVDLSLVFFTFENFGVQPTKKKRNPKKGAKYISLHLAASQLWFVQCWEKRCSLLRKFAKAESIQVRVLSLGRITQPGQWLRHYLELFYHTRMNMSARKSTVKTCVWGLFAKKRRIIETCLFRRPVWRTSCVSHICWKFFLWSFHWNWSSSSDNCTDDCRGKLWIKSVLWITLIPYCARLGYLSNSQREFLAKTTSRPPWLVRKSLLVVQKWPWELFNWVI